MIKHLALFAVFWQVLNCWDESHAAGRPDPDRDGSFRRGLLGQAGHLHGHGSGLLAVWTEVVAVQNTDTVNLQKKKKRLEDRLEGNISKQVGISVAIKTLNRKQRELVKQFGVLSDELSSVRKELEKRGVADE